MLKLAGLCCRAKAGQGCSCGKCASCTEEKSQSQNGKGCGPTERKACCAFTLADVLVSHAQLPDAVDLHSDLPPPSFLSAAQLPEFVLAQTRADFAAGLCPQAVDTPLFLRVHSFLL